MTPNEVEEWRDAFESCEDAESLKHTADALCDRLAELFGESGKAYMS